MEALPVAPDTRAFYHRVLQTLQEAGLPFLVGGTYALRHYTGIGRHSKDLDVFVRRADLDRALATLRDAGYATELPYPHWLAKARHHDAFVDLIFRSGNGVSEVDDAWFRGAPEAEVLGLRARLCPPEMILWTKAFIQERERFDGADVIHLVRAVGPQLDWAALLGHFGEHWRVLLAHLVLFGFVYPADRHRVPRPVMDELMRRLREEEAAPPPADPVCRGTLLSRAQYLVDVERGGLADARLGAETFMDAGDVAAWTDAVEDKDRPL